MTLPEIREELYTLARALKNKGLGEEGDRLEQLAAATRRERIGRRPDSSVPMTEEVRARIRELAREFPDHRLDQIAAMVNVNPGRVYETLHGKRQ